MSALVATVRLVDFSAIVHGVTQRELDIDRTTFCGRDAEGIAYGDGRLEYITCRACRRKVGGPIP